MSAGPEAPGPSPAGSTATLVVRAGTVVTMDPSRRVIADGAVAVSGPTIVAVGRGADVVDRHPGVPVHHVPSGVVIPGLVDAHQHLTGDRLVRSSIPDDLPPGASIFEWAVPVHAHQSADDEQLSATLAAVEAATNGVTTVVEAGTVAHPARVAAGLTAVGLRGTTGTWGWDREDLPFGGPTDEVLDRQAAVLDAFPPGGLVTGWVTLVGHDLMSDDLLAGASDLARGRGAGLTFHISPHGRDAPAWLARTGRRPLVHFAELGALGPHVLLAHAVHLDDAEVEALLAAGVAVACCPWGYLRLGSGISGAGRHWHMAERGGRVALGCDSENAGDQIDVLRAAALFAGLAKDTRRDPTTSGAHLALELATVRGAEAVGLGGVTGSLEPGKAADLAVLDGELPSWAPPGSDVALQLVWGTDGRSVCDVLVAGDWVVRDRRPVRVDLAELAAAAAEARTALLARAGIDPPSRWPVVR